MDRIGKLNQFAEDHDIGVFYKNIPGIKSFSVPGAVVLDTDFMYHPGKEEVALAYGLGSCYYENFYTEKGFCTRPKTGSCKKLQICHTGTSAP